MFVSQHSTPQLLFREYYRICILVLRLNRERFITVSEEGFTYQAFNNDVNRMRWDEIDRITIVRSGGRHRISWWQLRPTQGSSFEIFHDAPFYIGHNLSILNRGWFSYKRARSLLHDLLSVKLKGRVFRKHHFEETAGWGSSLGVKHHVEAANILESWGDFHLRLIST